MTFDFLKEIDNMDLSGLKKILRDLKLYNSLNKELGKRGAREYEKIKTGDKNLSVEYSNNLSKDYVVSKSLDIFIKVFGITDILPESIKFLESDNLKGGMRLFLDDKVLDLTYSKIERQLV